MAMVVEVMAVVRVLAEATEEMVGRGEERVVVATVVVEREVVTEAAMAGACTEVHSRHSLSQRRTEQPRHTMQSASHHHRLGMRRLQHASRSQSTTSVAVVMWAAGMVEGVAVAMAGMQSAARSRRNPCRKRTVPRCQRFP